MHIHITGVASVSKTVTLHVHHAVVRSRCRVKESIFRFFVSLVGTNSKKLTFRILSWILLKRTHPKFRIKEKYAPERFTLTIVAFCQLVVIPSDLFDMIVFILIRCWWAKFWRPGSQSLSDQKTEARVWSESFVRKGIEPYNNADYSVFIKSWCWLCYSGIYYPRHPTTETVAK